MKPIWLRQRYLPESMTAPVRRILVRYGVHTVCEGAACPNRQHCYADGTATFLILGPTCTRHCGYCAIEAAQPQPPDPTEAERVAAAVRQLSLRHVVITSVTRDDLADGGAAQFVATIEQIRAIAPRVAIEVLIPDFLGQAPPLQQVLAARPTVLNHNLETVERLYARVRPEARYHRSLQLLQRTALAATAVVKSGLMLGLGEQADEIDAALVDLRDVGCQMVTLGQYLQPTPHHLPVERYVTPQEFEHWHQRAEQLGFRSVASAPLVRSSWHAGQMYQRSSD